MTEKGNTKKTIDIDAASLPKGGGAYKGMEGIAGVDCFTGAGSVRIPVYATACRGIEPKLTLEYASTNGNGLFGMGFSLALPAVSRRTSSCIPTYDDNSDVFVLQDGAELAFQGLEIENGYTVRSFMRYKESEFERIRYFKNESESFWQIRGRDNSLSRFGACENSRVSGSHEVFSWLISSWEDEKGNRIEYRYTPQGYPESLRYGNSNSAGDFCFEIRFAYTESRNDPFTAYNSGFRRETAVLCRSVSMWHNFGSAARVREMSFTYSHGKANSLSFLKRISTVCYNRGESMALPDIDFKYTAFDLENFKGEFKLFEQKNLPFFEINKDNFYFVDLDGEGAAGILYSDGRSCFYAPPTGDFSYSSLTALPDFPAHRDLTRYRLADLEGNGKYQLVVYTSGSSGYYERENGRWSPFIPFEQQDSESPRYIEQADLQGDRRAHRLITQNQWLRYYPWTGKGAAGPVLRDIPKGFPHSAQNSSGTIARFLEIAGDGLSHRVLIENGRVEYYPNLGYGRFGERVSMENAPYIPDGLDASRLFFADLDGSGTADFIYVHPDRADIYSNYAGRVFSEPVSVALPEAFTADDALNFANVFGNGTDALIFTKIDIRGVRHYCMDFTNRQKPYILTEINGNSGSITELESKSSAAMYFEDKRAGRPWRVPLHFPVQIIARKRVTDEISQTVTITKYSYADGMYDFERGEFRGFRLVDEEESLYTTEDAEPRNVINKRVWHYSPIDNTSQLLPHVIKAADIAEGEKSLWSRPVRRELYEGGACVEVREYRYETAEVGRGSYFARPLEQLTRINEKTPDDPRIEHELNIEADSYGNITRKAIAAYPRRESPLSARLAKAQSALMVRETRSSYSNTTSKDGAWRLGVLSEELLFEYSGINRDFFSAELLTPLLDDAFENQIEYGRDFDGSPCARLFAHKRVAYWNDALENALPCGEVGAAALPRHTDEAVFPKNSALTESFDEQEIASSGYFFDDGMWWKRSLVNTYDRNHFFLLSGEESDFLYSKSLIEYDAYSLLPVRSIEYIDNDTYNEITTEIDYTVMKHKLICGVNGEITQILHNPLGLAETITEYKISDIREGNGDIEAYSHLPVDFRAVIAEPERYLQDMSACYLWEPRAWQDRRQPACVISLERGNDISSGLAAKIRLTIEYLDAYGNTVERRRLAERDNWSVRSKAAFDGEGHEIASFPPFFADSPLWIPMNGVVLPPEISKYDLKGRLIRKETPAEFPGGADYGYFFSTVEYLPWEEREYDNNRNVKSSQYYREFIDKYQNDEDILNSLKKSEAFDRVPIVRFLNPLGAKIGEGTDGLYSFFRRDIQGNITGFADARQKDGFNLKTVYDMTNTILFTLSKDSGAAARLENALGKLAYSVNGEGVRKAYSYDGLKRLVEVRVLGYGTAEKIEYGEFDGSHVRNLRGRVYRRFDQGGELVYSYDMRGNPREKERRFPTEHTGFIDWALSVPLENAAFKESYVCNAFGKITENTCPDGSKLIRRYNRRGFLSEAWAEAGGKRIPIIDSIYYCAGEKQTRISYANGAYTKNSYNRLTARLEKSITAVAGKILRSNSYTYDPAGHITQIRDLNAAPSFTKGQMAPPYLDYTYDIFYRLKTALGRELTNAGDFGSMIPYRREYSYDDGGNLVELRHISEAGRYTLSMEIDGESNRLIAAAHASDSWRIEYDGCGNPLSLPNIREIQWDYEGRLSYCAAVIREGGNDEESYIYDHEGKRIRKITGSLTAGGMAEICKTYIGAYSVCNGGKRRSIRLTDGELPLATLEFGGAEPELTFQICDHMNSVVMEMDAAGDVICSREYFPFGGIAIDLAGKLNAAQKHYLFANKERDMTGLYYFETRYYSSYLGRFISPDNTENIKPEKAHSYQLYAYCNNDPVNYKDPDGRCKEDPDWGVKDTTNYGQLLKRAIGPPPLGMVRPHAHHIVFKGEFASSTTMQRVLTTSRNILLKHGINYQTDLDNLMWAPNHSHTIENAAAVRDKLKAAHALGITDDQMRAELQRIGKEVFL